MTIWWYYLLQLVVLVVCMVGKHLLLRCAFFGCPFLMRLFKKSMPSSHPYLDVEAQNMRGTLVRANWTPDECVSNVIIGTGPAWRMALSTVGVPKRNYQHNQTHYV